MSARPDGKPHHPDDVSIFPYSELGKNLKLIDRWWTTGRAAEMSGRMQAGTEASRYSEGSGRKNTLSGQMMLVCLASGLDDTSSGRLTGNLKSSIFLAVQSLLKMLWKVESLFPTSLHISDFVQTEWGQNTNKIKLLLIKLYLILKNLIAILTQSMRFDTLNIALCYKDSFYCDW
jgi:hypothetical protein